MQASVSTLESVKRLKGRLGNVLGKVIAVRSITPQSQTASSYPAAEGALPLFPPLAGGATVLLAQAGGGGGRALQQEGRQRLAGCSCLGSCSATFSHSLHAPRLPAGCPLLLPQVRDELGRVLEDDSEVVDMYLTRKAKARASAEAAWRHARRAAAHARRLLSALVNTGDARVVAGAQGGEAATEEEHQSTTCCWWRVSVSDPTRIFAQVGHRLGRRVSQHQRPRRRFCCWRPEQRPSAWRLDC